LSRLEWLASRRISNLGASGLLVSFADLRSALETHFEGSARAQLVAGYSVNESGEWLEQTRGFVVGHLWPN